MNLITTHLVFAFSRPTIQIMIPRPLQKNSKRSAVKKCLKLLKLRVWLSPRRRVHMSLVLKKQASTWPWRQLTPGIKIFWISQKWLKNWSKQTSTRTGKYSLVSNPSILLISVSNTQLSMKSGSNTSTTGWVPMSFMFTSSGITSQDEPHDFYIIQIGLLISLIFISSIFKVRSQIPSDWANSCKKGS